MSQGTQATEAAASASPHPRLLPTSAKTPGAMATLVQEWEEKKVSRTLPRAPFLPWISLWAEELPLHLPTSPFRHRSLLGTLLATDPRDLPINSKEQAVAVQTGLLSPIWVLGQFPNFSLDHLLHLRSA